MFYEPAFMAASAPVFGRDVMAGLVWRRGMPARLIGFFPVAIERRRYGLKIPVLVGWTHPYGPLGTPLIDRDCGEAAVAAWLDHLAADPDAAEAPADAVSAGRGRRRARLRGRARPSRRPQRSISRCTAARCCAPDRRPRRLSRRRDPAQEAQGTAPAAQAARRHRRADVDARDRDPPTLTAALADFLALEAAGWKGRAGTAAQGNDAVRCFVDEAVTALAAEGKASVARLALDGRAIAAIVTLRSGDAAWCWKIAYDEAFARASPGVQLLLDVTQALLDDASIARADSCATPDHPMIDHIWRERLALSDRLMCVANATRRLFAHLCRHGVAAPLGHRYAQAVAQSRCAGRNARRALRTASP